MLSDPYSHLLWPTRSREIGTFQTNHEMQCILVGGDISHYWCYLCGCSSCESLLFCSHGADTSPEARRLVSPDEEFRSDPGASVSVGSWTMEMNRLKKLFSNPRSPFVIDLLAYWNDRIFPCDTTTTPYHYHPLLDDGQQHEYNELLIEVASVNSDAPSGFEIDEEAEDLAHVAYKPLRYTTLSSGGSRSDMLESSEGDELDNGEQSLDYDSGEDTSDVYEARGSE